MFLMLLVSCAVSDDSATVTRSESPSVRLEVVDYVCDAERDTMPPDVVVDEMPAAFHLYDLGYVSEPGGMIEITDQMTLIVGQALSLPGCDRQDEPRAYRVSILYAG